MTDFGAPAVRCQTCHDVVYCAEVDLGQGKIVFEGVCRCGSTTTVTSGPPSPSEQRIDGDDMMAR